MGLFYPPEDKITEDDIEVGLLTEFADSPLARKDAFIKKETTLAELRLWYSSFESMMKKGPMQETAGSLMLRMHFKVAVMLVETSLQTKPTDTPEMWDIVDLCRKVLIELGGSGSPRFALDVGVVIPLYLVGIKSSVVSLRRDAQELLTNYPRREGLWDSVVSGKVVEWILEVEMVYEDRARGQIPAWARMRSMGMIVNVPERRMDLYAFQRKSEEDSTLIKMERAITF